MGKNHDRKAKPAAGKTLKGMKADKAVKKFRKLEGKLWTREYLLKIAEFDGATIAPANPHGSSFRLRHSDSARPRTGR